MGGDYTRVTFNPVKGFSGLHKQQGRVSLDWEFNEFEQILDRRDRAEMFDAVGRTFVPATTPDAFLIQGSGGLLTIGPGRAYVDGILAECFGDMSSAATTVRDDQLGGVHGPGPVAYDQQPFVYQILYPGLSTGPNIIDLVYLDVWQREVTVFEDPALREIALNGPDTATRVQTAWQVKVLNDVPGTSCAAPPQAWIDLTAPSTARFTALTTPVAPSPGPCVINPAGGYSGLENRLYRVEVHRAGTLNGPTKAQFKWSRDNASLAARVLAVAAAGPGKSVITVASTGRDAFMRFAKGDHLELINDHVEWAMRETGLGGEMAVVEGINHATGEIQIDQDLSGFAVAPALHPRIRRWDIAKLGDPSVRDVDNGTAFPLEDGIYIQFGANDTDTLHAGDYIVFAARTADGSIETVENAPPRGILHHFMQLALVSNGAPIQDCRPKPPAPHIGCCTKVVRPGESIQAAIDDLSDAGGCVCLKAGRHQIREPIHIRRPNVTLHGESIGAIVFSELALMLIIEGTSNIAVHDIAFETIGGFTHGPVFGNPALVVSGGNQIAVHDCDVRVVKDNPATGVLIVKSADVRIDRNVFDGVQAGVVANGSERIDVADNRILAFGKSTHAGDVGVLLEPVADVCQVERNVIKGFDRGIRVVHLEQVLNTPHQVGAPRIVGNVVDRNKRVTPGTTALWGISVEGIGVIVHDNAVAIRIIRHMGIQAFGTKLQIADNTVRSTFESTGPIGIDLAAPSFEDGSVISGNHLQGLLLAIRVRSCHAARILNNDIRLEVPRGTIGIVVDGSTGTLVSGNLVMNPGQAILVKSANETQVIANKIASGDLGVSASGSTALLIADNIIGGMSNFGVGVVGGHQTSTICRNRLSNCCRENGSAAILVHKQDDEAVVEFNDVLNTGVNPEGQLAKGVKGIELLSVARARVQGNHVYYSEPKQLPRDLECRALSVAAAATSTFLDGSNNNRVLVLDNSFIGVGKTALVELGPKSLHRLTVADNYCEHYNGTGAGAGAVFSIFAGLIVVQGNQTKAQEPFLSFDFHGFGVATFTGNVGRPIGAPATQVPPAPTTNNNIEL